MYWFYDDLWWFMIHLAYFNNIMYDSTEALWFFMKLILLASAPHRMKESTWSMEIKIISKYYLIWPQDRNLRNLLGLLYDDPKLLTGTIKEGSHYPYLNL